MLCVENVRFFMKKYKRFRGIICSRWILSVLIMLIGVIISKLITGTVLLILLDGVSDTIKTLYLLYSCIFDILVVLAINALLSKQDVSRLEITSRIIEGYLKGIFYGSILSILVIFVICVGLSGRLEINKDVKFMIVFNMLVGFLIQSTSEEVLFRGYIQSIIEKSVGSRATIVIQSIIFSLIHILSIRGHLLVSINLFLFSIILGLIMFYFNNIFVVSGIHFVWNVFIAFVIDGRINGIVVNGYVTKLNFNGSSILTGGEFGLEGSFLVTII